MNVITKNIGKFFIALVVASFAFCLAGCQKELTGKEAVEEYESIEEVELLKNEAASDLGDMVHISYEISQSESDDTKLSLYEDLVKKNTEIDRVCNDLINLKGYPKACEDLQSHLAESAENVKKSAECFERAGFYYMQGNMNTGTKRVNEANEYTDSASDAVAKYNEAKDALLEQQ